MFKRFLVLWSASVLFACANIGPSQSDTLYDDLGGREGLEAFLDIFIVELARDPYVSRHFRDTNLERFKEKQVEHLCMLAKGPCEYTGDHMVAVHAGMNIDAATFNRTTEVMIRAMKKQGWNVSARNRLLARIAELRHEVVYQ